MGTSYVAKHAVRSGLYELYGLTEAEIKIVEGVDSKKV
jgi:hypothetical protein